MSRANVIALAFVVPLLAACATTGGTGAAVHHGSSSLITRQEIQQAHVSDAYQAIVKLEPQWLRSQGAMTPAPAGPQDLALPTVIVDGQEYGDLSQLRNIQAMDVQSMKYLGPSDATTEYGTGHSGGAIVVTLVH